MITTILIVAAAIVIGTIISVALAYVAIGIAFNLYYHLAPRTYIQDLNISASHLCNTSDCGVTVQFKIENNYPDTEQYLEVKKNGQFYDNILEGGNIGSEYNEYFSGVDIRAFDGPGVYDFYFSLRGNVGNVLRRDSLQAHDRIVIMDLRSENLITAQSSKEVPTESADERVQISSSVSINGKDDRIRINCKYTELRAITFLTTGTSELTSGAADGLQSLSEASPTPFLIDADNSNFVHPPEMEFTVDTGDGDPIELGEISIGETRPMPDAIVMDRGVTIIGRRRSGAVPFFPTRIVTWQIQLHMSCVES